MTDFDDEMPPATADGIPIPHDPTTGEVIETGPPHAPNVEPKMRGVRSRGGAEFDGDIIKLQNGRTLELPESIDERPECDDEGEARNEDAGEERAPESGEGAGDQPNEEASEEQQAPSTEPNEAVITEFLTAISNYAKRATEGMTNPGVLQMSRLHPANENENMVLSRFQIGDVDNMVKTARGDSNHGHNCYIEGRTVRPDLDKKKRGKLSDTRAVFALTVDSDADKGMAATMTAQPTMRVETSPGNEHMWFCFEIAISADEAKELGAAMRKASGADHDTGNPVQPYRVAGTTNYPSDLKRARGRATCVTRITEHSGRMWTPEDLREEFKAIQQSRREEAKARKGAEGAGPEGSRRKGGHACDELGLPDDLLNLIVNGVDASEEDRSRKFMSVVRRLKQRHHYLLEAIVELFEKYPNGIAKKYEGRIRQEAERVYNKIADEEAERLNLPEIHLIKGALTRVIREAENALIYAGVPIYSRAGELVHPVTEECAAFHNRKTKVARLARYTPESLTFDLADSARFFAYNKKGEVFEADPPMQIAKHLLANNHHWRVPRVTGVITAPLLRPDGSLLDGQKAHYDRVSQLYYEPTILCPFIPEHPTIDEAMAALDLLLPLLGEFPFVNELDRSVALSGILTALIRPSMPVAPLHLIRAHTAGTGKSYLMDLISVIATGQLCPVIGWHEDEAENEKRIGAQIMTGVAIMSLDNCDHDIGGAALCKATERPLVRYRILGKSEAPEFECRTAIFATGNNTAIRDDMTRRTVTCNLDAGMERPELRPFHIEPVEIVLADRGRYVAAAITIVRAYLRSGESVDLRPLGSYGVWCCMVREPLVWLGEPDPVASMDAARAEDPVLSSYATFFGLMPPDTWLKPTEIIRHARGEADKPNSSDLWDLLVDVAGNGDTISAKKLGWWLKRGTGRVISNKRLKVRNVGSGQKEYCVVDV
jgi:RepB DNA-primase from phage plasmid